MAWKANIQQPNTLLLFENQTCQNVWYSDPAVHWLSFDQTSNGPFQALRLFYVKIYKMLFCEEAKP